MVAALAGASVFLLSGAVVAGAAPLCSTASVLAGSNFEIDTNANLKVDGPADCIDWLADGSGSAMRAGVITKNDLPTGATDNSFGQGSQENDINPTVVTGSIPPNKSDLKTFGLYAETAPNGKFLDLFWSRVQNPSGTTNMDFELNQKFCDPSATPTNCSTNGVTPLRTVGDKLITYDLANGGTVPTISIRTWTSLGVWGLPTVLTNTSLGSINSSAIAATDSGGIGALDPFTFGEAAISFDALFPNLQPGQCGALGSAYLKSRSSDSFQAEVKDFIAPEKISLSNCTSLTTSATPSVTIGSTIHDVATLSGATGAASGTITFDVFAPGDTTCATPISVPLAKTVNGNGDYTSGDYTPTVDGTYRWIAHYSGDANNSPSDTACNDANETSVVSPRNPTVTTDAHGDVTLGVNGNDLVDTATLAGATAHAGTTITYHLYFGSDCSAGNEVTGSPVTNTSVNGDGSYDSPAIHISQAGTYRWIANYEGDTNNAKTTNLCNGAKENVVVSPRGPTVTTDAHGDVTLGVNGNDLVDTATLAGATAHAGTTITYHLYFGSDCSAGNEV